MEIRWDNIRKDKYVNFEKRKSTEINSYGRPYDINSIMHYSLVSNISFSGMAVSVCY